MTVSGGTVHGPVGTAAVPSHRFRSARRWLWRSAVVRRPPQGNNEPPTPTTEDREVLDHIANKGREISRPLRVSDGSTPITLTVKHVGKPEDRFTFTDADHKMIVRLRTVQVLDLWNVNATDAGLAAAAVPQLERLTVGGRDITDAGLKALAASRSLTHVNLIDLPKVTDAGVRELAGLPKLTSLHLQYVPIDGSAFATFAGSPTPAVVSVADVGGFTDDGARHLAALPNLKRLVLPRGPKLTAAGIKAIVTVRVIPVEFRFDLGLIDDELAALVTKGWRFEPPRRGLDPTRAACPGRTGTKTDGGAVRPHRYESGAKETGGNAGRRRDESGAEPVHSVGAHSLKRRRVGRATAILQ